MSLADRMRQAADTLEEAAGVYGAFNCQHYLWSAAGLRKEADHVEEDECCG